MIFVRTATGSHKVESWDLITSRPNFIDKISKAEQRLLVFIVSKIRFIAG